VREPLHRNHLGIGKRASLEQPHSVSQLSSRSDLWSGPGGLLCTPQGDEMFQKFAHKLTDEQKIYIVRQLASYKTSSAIARDLKENFGIDITAQAIDHYHPDRASGATLSPRFKDLFRETRKAYLAAAAEVGTNDPLVRMHWREAMVLEAWDAGDYRMANAMLDSIAKEAGGAFNSKHRHGRFGMADIQPSAIVTITGPCEPMPDEVSAEPSDANADAAALRRVRTG
jgi:hypothetical protein